jgi:hypothetical protein
VRQFRISRPLGGITADNLRNGKGVTVAALEGVPLLFLANGLYFFFLELELGGHQLQNMVNCTAAL